MCLYFFGNQNKLEIQLKLKTQKREKLKNVEELSII